MERKQGKSHVRVHRCTTGDKVTVSGFNGKPIVRRGKGGWYITGKAGKKTLIKTGRRA